MNLLNAIALTPQGANVWVLGQFSGARAVCGSAEESAFLHGWVMLSPTFGRLLGAWCTFPGSDTVCPTS